MNRIFVALVLSFFSFPVLADGHVTGDAEAGKKAFNKCKSCHMIVSDGGDVIVKGGKTGPNLWNIASRSMGTLEGFKYSKLMVAAAEQELIMDEANFHAYLSDPTAWIQDAVGGKGKSKMLKQRVKEKDAVNIWAFLVVHSDS